jgi:adenine phosphoribosyltransferase
MADIRRQLIAGFPMVSGHPDVAGVLRQPQLLRLLGPGLAAPYLTRGVTKVLAPEARGPILGALVAEQLGAGLVVVRKDERNHPGADLRLVSEPTWRGHPESFIARSFDLAPSDRVLVVDDWITTGSSIDVAREVIDSAHAAYLGCSVLVSKADPDTLDRLKVHWLVGFDELMSAAAGDDASGLRSG